MYHKLKKLKLFNFPLKINYKIKRKNIYIDRYIYVLILFLSITIMFN